MIINWDMKTLLPYQIAVITGLSAALLAAQPATAQTFSAVFTNSHAEFGAEYDATEGIFEIVAEDVDGVIPGGQEAFEPGDALMVGVASTQTTNPGFSFLSGVGDPVWILPQANTPGQIFLGFGAEEVPTGIFENEEITFTFEGLTGPGDLYFYTVDEFNNAELFFSSEPGAGAPNAFDVEIPDDRHANWLFTAPGNYQLTFGVRGTRLSDNALIEGGPATFDFFIAPEPSASALLALVTIGFLTTRRRRNR